MLDSAGSIEGFFLEGDDPASPDIGAGLESFCARARNVDLRPVYGRRMAARPGAHAFFPLPSAGSACKRLNLFLRWMVRRDAIDLGAWTRVSPARLIIPLDVHVIRVGQCLGLTRYASPGWRMAASITASLRQIDPVGSREVRLRVVSPGDGRAVRLQDAGGGFPLPAARGLPATRA